MSHKVREIYDTNRTMKRKPVRSQGWCDCCDGAIVSDGQRCPACGNRNKPYRDKK